jgi:RNA polymerase sigma-70 factor (ECF subfamily)
MAQSTIESTDPELLRRVSSLWDNPAWGEFFERYSPLVTAWCRGYGLDSESVNEVCQRVWVELARRMPAYQYDPGGSFRAWLKRLCYHRVVDLFRERRNRPTVLLRDDDFLVSLQSRRSDPNAWIDDDDPAAQRLLLLEEARLVQEIVRRKVKPIRWELFWRVVIDGEPMNETAADLGLKYATVYAAVNHVGQLLREEGERRSGKRG